MSPIVIDLTADSESNHEGNSSSDSDSDSAIARDSASDSGSDSDSDSSGSDSDEPQGDENLPGRDDASDSSSDVVPASDDGSGMARHVEVITISDSDSDTTQRPAPRPHLSSPARSSSSPDPSGAVRVTAGHHDSGALGDAYPPPEHSDVPMDVDVLGRSPTPSIEDSKFDAQPSISNHRTTGQIEAEIALWFSSTPSRKRPASSSPSKSRRPVKRALRESSSPALGVESDDEEKAVEDQVVIWTAGSFKDDEGLELAGCGVSFGKDDRRNVSVRCPSYIAPSKQTAALLAMVYALHISEDISESNPVLISTNSRWALKVIEQWWSNDFSANDDDVPDPWRQRAIRFLTHRFQGSTQFAYKYPSNTAQPAFEAIKLAKRGRKAVDALRV